MMAMSLETPRILVVDDEPEILDTLKEFLDVRGYRVTTAGSGAEALSAVQAERPHLVLLDIVMPGLNGLVTLRRILETDPTVGIMMLTSVDDHEVVREAIGRGAYDYITKPINFDYLELSILTRLAQTDLSLRGRQRQPM
ncbi:MAG: response regulator [Candidatus Rokubacteria bacterium]|nr:response regulator [Candidatus Rokubacteria bacterium]